MERLSTENSRLISLDYLRGYFVIVIIIDHLSRFPSAWQIITGQGLLWATAAEGFVMISGLMVGFVRGYKNLNKPFFAISSKLLKRSVILYAWMVLGSLAYVWLTWSLSARSDMPWYNAPTGDWATVLNQVVTMQVPHVWVHFLYLYSIFLLLAIPAVWLLRNRQPWIVACLSCIGYIYGLTANVEWLRMQIIFFIPVIVGFYLPTITQWWQKSHHKTVLSTLIYTAAASTVALSIAYVAFEQYIPGGKIINGLFNIATFSIARIAIATIWFTALVLLFHKITPWLKTHTGGIVQYLGTHSLTAYIAHGLILCIIAIFIPIKDSFVVNTLSGALALLGVYVLIKSPIGRLLPR